MPERFNEQFSSFVNTALKEYGQERGIQIRYASKIHPTVSQSSVLRLEELLNESKLTPTPPYVLFNQYGKPLPFTIQPSGKQTVGPEVVLSEPKVETRANLLLRFVREEAERYKRGELTHLSSNEELRARFDYANTSSFYRLLGREGLIQERKLLIMERGREKLSPSSDLAWMLGVLSGGGYVTLRTGAIGLTTYEDSLLQAFKSTAEGLFNTNVYINPSLGNKQDADKEYKRAHLHSTATARALGSLSRSGWPQTITEKHSWVFANPLYVWKFLNGFFEVRGHITTRGIIFTTSYLSVGNVLAHLLTRVGIENPKFQSPVNIAAEISGVGIHNLKDQKLFALNITSKIPEKEQRLDAYRRKNISVNTQEDFIEEWKRLKILLGHIPNSYEILILKKQRLTKFHYSSFANRFGEGSFIKARENLERIISEKEEGVTNYA